MTAIVSYDNAEKFIAEKENRGKSEDDGLFVEFEIAIIRVDFEHGYESYGWDSPDKKIVLWSDSLHESEFSQENVNSVYAMAKVMANALNAENM